MSKKKLSRDSPSNRSATDMSTGYECPTYYNRSGLTKVKNDQVIIVTARRFLASKNQFQLEILEFGYLGHRIGCLALHSIHICRSNKG